MNEFGEKLLRIEALLDRLNSKIDAFLLSLARFAEGYDARLAALEERVAALEAQARNPQEDQDRDPQEDQDRDRFDLDVSQR